MTYVTGLFAIVLLTVLLSLFIKKKWVVFVVMISLILAGFFIMERSKYTTYDFSDNLGEESKIERLTIRVKENPEEGFPGSPVNKVEIKDQQMIERITDDLKSLKLKEEEHPDLFKRKYELEFVVTNKVEEEVYETEFVKLYLDENHLNGYEIISDSNHLETLKSLEENKDLEWEELDY